MQESIDVGCAPTDESCAQVGSDGYYELARKECRAYVAQLRRVFGDEPDGARLAVKSNPHDFGTYLSIVCYYDPESQNATDYAFRCESQSPAEWDQVARIELGLNGR